MRDFTYLRGSRTTVVGKKWHPTPESLCVTCGDPWSRHWQHPTDTSCTCMWCTCDAFVVDTSGPPDEVQNITQWHYADSGRVIEDPDEIAELERRLALVGGSNGRTSTNR